MSLRQSLEMAGGTDIGCVRPNNEDNFSLDKGLGLMVVADGMGGHNSGEVASSIATSVILDFARKMLGGEKSLVPEGGSPALSVRGRQLEYLVKTANTMIYEKGRAFPKDAGMGTTVVAVLSDAKSLSVAHVGDSRLYLFRNGILTQLTQDHSLVEEQVRLGRITSAQAVASGLQNILTRALGSEPDVKVDVSEHPLFPGDIVLLVTDGLTKMLDDAAMVRILSGEKGVERVVARLIEEARKAGGVDNITVVAARVVENSALGVVKNMLAKALKG